MKVTRLLEEEEIEFKRVDLATVFSKIRHLREDRRQYVFNAKRELRAMDDEIETLMRKAEKLSRIIDTAIEEGEPSPNAVMGVAAAPNRPGATFTPAPALERAS